MATMNDLVSCCDSEVVVMLPFLQKCFVFNTIDLIVMERGTKRNQPWVPTMTESSMVTLQPSPFHDSVASSQNLQLGTKVCVE